MNRAMTLSLAAVLGMIVTPVGAASISNLESWNTNASGWVSSHAFQYVASGGVGNTGYVETFVNATNPNPAALKALSTNSPSGGVFNGDIDATYGGGDPEGDINISFYHRNTSATGTPVETRVPVISIFDSSNEFAATTTRWRNIFTGAAPIVTSQWTLFETTINTNWSDAEANAAGWSILSTGTDTWANLMQSVGSIRIQADGPLNVGSFAGSLGVDELTFANATVPEPGSAGLLLLGTTLLGFVRRRKRRGGSSHR